MFTLRYNHIIIILIVTFVRRIDNNEEAHNGNDCPFSKIIEDIFKVHNKSTEKGIFLEDAVKAKDFLTKISNVTIDNKLSDLQDDEINKIIESINRIKKNITTGQNNADKDDFTEAIIFDYTKGKNYSLPVTKPNNTYNLNTTLAQKYTLNDSKINSNTERPTFVEILTIEPNNTNRHNTSAHNIIEVLKHLMPMFNSTLTKEIHNFTVIERDHSKNHSFSAVKNISTIIVTYCDNENLTKIELTEDEGKETEIKYPDKLSSNIDDADFLTDDNIKNVHQIGHVDDDDDESEGSVELTAEEEKDIREATDYGIKKMNELYTVMEPKLYSMGLWMEDGNPARYVAAFNAPSEETARLARYGYASLQAAAKLRQLTSVSGGDGLEGRTEEAQFPSVSALRQSSLLQHCPSRGAPKCPPASKRYRTHDGTCNNFNRPRWGSTMTPVQRFVPPSYSDGIQAPRRSVLGPKLPSAREISTLVHEAQDVETPTITHLLMQWGQFLDHDITATSQTRGFNGSVPRCCRDGGRDFVPKELMHPECMPISVPSNDAFYGPRGVRCLDFIRSSPAPRDDCALGWREQINQVSAYIDASPLYGSSAQKSDKLRLFRNGMLQYGRVQQRRPLLPPENKDELCRGGAVSTDCFKSGDARVNEHPGLVAAHIVWLRQHNRMAQELAHLNPHWSDEKIYQETRKIVGAIIQHITYREFLPLVLGSEVMKLFELMPLKKGFYKNYDPKVNPSPASSFGSAAFRFGHSLVQPSMMRYDRFHRPMTNNVTLHNELSNPSNIWSMGAVDRLLLGMVNQPIQKRDEFITEELTNHLFQTPKFDFGMDLAAINIQRGRDHGVPAYNSWREPCGLSPIREFSDLFKVMPARAVRKLQSLYRHIDDIDLFTGGMAERPVVGGLVGPTFACIIAQQFSNLRKGDRFWYENGGFESSFTPAQLQQIRRISLAQVLCRTLDTIDNIQPFAFLSPDNDGNARLSCSNGQLNNFDLSPWTEIDVNDIGKFEKKSDKNPFLTFPSTTIKTTTTTDKISDKVPTKRPIPMLPIFNTTKIQNSVTRQKPATIPTNTTNTKLNQTNLTFSDKSANKTNVFNPIKIDDKLDFKNKTRRYDDTDSDNDGDRLNHDDFDSKQRYEYDDDDDTQSVQSVQINNFSHKRPGSYNRPVISVTENIDKFTYLINYVPRPTQSWRKPTRKPYKDRDVVKITYQNYDETYKRPHKPYYDRHDDRPHDFNYRHDLPNRHTTRKDDFQSSARANDDVTLNDKLLTSTTDNYQKLVTFGYVGTYKRPENTKTDEVTHKTPDITTDDKHDYPGDALSKDFSVDDDTRLLSDNKRLSTFFRLDTSTQPYASSQRPTRKHDGEHTDLGHDNKYFFIKNVLLRHPELRLTLTEKPLHVEDETNTDDIIDENYNSPGHHDVSDIQDRSDAITLPHDAPKAIKPQKLKIPAANKGPAKIPTVAFQVIPSENSPSLWAMYDENSEIPEEDVVFMPSSGADPYALREIPRPLMLPRMKSRRKPGSNKN